MDLTQKLAVLVALTAVSHAGAVHLLDTKFMTRNENNAPFVFKNSTKVGTKPPPAVKYFAYEQDASLCVVKTVDEYTNRSQGWRTIEKSSQLLLSTIQPHTPGIFYGIRFD